MGSSGVSQAFDGSGVLADLFGTVDAPAMPTANSPPGVPVARRTPIRRRCGGRGRRRHWRVRRGGRGDSVGEGVMVAVGDGVGVVVGQQGVTTSVCVVRVSVGAAQGGWSLGKAFAVVGDAVGGVGLLASTFDAPNSSSAGIGVRMAMRYFHTASIRTLGGSLELHHYPPIIHLPGENGVLSIVTFVLSNTARRRVSRMGRSGSLTEDSSGSLKITDHRAPNDNPLPTAPSVTLLDTL